MSGTQKSNFRYCTMYPVPSLFVIESHVICPYPLSHNRNIHSRSGSNIQELKFDAYKIIYRDFRFRELYTIYRYLKFFFHVLRKLSISDFSKQICIRHILSFLVFFYAPQLSSMLPLIFSQLPRLEQPAPKRFVSMLLNQGVQKKTKKLNMCQIHICFEKSLIDNFLRT